MAVSGTLLSLIANPKAPNMHANMMEGRRNALKDKALVKAQDIAERQETRLKGSADVAAATAKQEQITQYQKDAYGLFSVMQQAPDEQTYQAAATKLGQISKANGFSAIEKAASGLAQLPPAKRALPLQKMVMSGISRGFLEAPKGSASGGGMTDNAKYAQLKEQAVAWSKQYPDRNKQDNPYARQADNMISFKRRQAEEQYDVKKASNQAEKEDKHIIARQVQDQKNASDLHYEPKITKRNLEQHFEMDPEIAAEVVHTEESAKLVYEFQEISKDLRANLHDIDQGLKALDDGAWTGPIISAIPSFRQSSVEFDNVRRRMGLGEIRQTTFGSLSKGELDIALAVAAPDDLMPNDLKDWMKRRRQYQQTLLDDYRDAAVFLSGKNPATGKQNKVGDWLNVKMDKKARQAEITARAEQELDGMSIEEIESMLEAQRKLEAQ